MKKLGYVHNSVCYGASPHLWMFEDDGLIDPIRTKNAMVAASLYESKRVNHDALVKALDDAASMSIFDVVSAFDALPDLVKHGSSHSAFQQNVFKSVAEIVHFKLICYNHDNGGGGTTNTFPIWFFIFQDLEHVSAFCNRDAATDSLLDANIVKLMRTVAGTGGAANLHKHVDIPTVCSILSNTLTPNNDDDNHPYIPLLLRIVREFCNDNKLNELAEQHIVTCTYVVSDQRAMLSISPLDAEAYIMC